MTSPARVAGLGVGGSGFNGAALFSSWPGDVADTVAASLYFDAASGGGGLITLKSDTGVFTVAGQSADLLKNWLLNSDTGSFTLSGQQADLLKNWLLSGDSGSFAVSGQQADLLKNWLLSGDAGTFAVSGQSADLLKNWLLKANTGAYAVSGQAADTFRGYSLSGDAGAFVLAGQSADTLKNWLLNSDTGTYAVAGQSADTYRGYSMSGDTGSYGLTGQSADTLKFWLLSSDTGTYALNGQSADLIYTSSTASVPVSSVFQTLRTVRPRAFFPNAPLSWSESTRTTWNSLINTLETSDIFSNTRRDLPQLIVAGTVSAPTTLDVNNPSVSVLMHVLGKFISAIAQSQYVDIR